MKSTALFCASLALVMFAAPNTAAAFEYNESVDGDLPFSNGNNPLPTFTFDIGANTVTGEMFFQPNPFAIDQDSFAFVVPTGMQISSAWASGYNQGSLFNAAAYSLSSGTAIAANGTLVETPNIAFSVNGATTIFTSPPLGEGLYNLTFAGMDVNTAQFCIGHYTFTFNVSSAGVPGDFDNDDDIDGRDFLVWQRGESPDPLSAEDLADWQEWYSTVPELASLAAVPEPAGVSLLAMGALFFPRRGRYFS